ncbi:MAG: c-type cytochrome [Pseudomonadota bacterium]
MKQQTWAVLMGTMLAAASGAAAAEGDAKRGAELAAACGGCHGETGNSEVPTFPKLAGQKAQYIVKQIADFQKGGRTDETMAGMAMGLTEKQDVLDIAAFYASQPVMKGSAEGADAKALAKGKEIYLEFKCNTCHGDDGKGKGSLFPVIGGQHKDYLAKTLTDLKTDVRKNDTTMMMAPLAKKLNAKQIEAVAEYLSTL